MNQIINIENLKVSYKTQQGPKEVVKGVSFSLRENELLALVGSSGSGKTTICKAISGLLDLDSVSNVNMTGRIERNTDHQVAFVFQDPYLSLDPTKSVGSQIEETIIINSKKSQETNRVNNTSVLESEKDSCKEKAIKLMEMVGIDSPEERYHQIPMSFSGGMRQRIAIAIALAMEPDVIIADELTSSLDEENTEQILTLLNELRDRLNTSIILVTHDLGLVKDYSDRVIVIQDGLIIDEGKTEEIFKSPKSSYTKDLLRYAGYKYGTEHTHGDLHFHNKIPHSHGLNDNKESHTHPENLDGILPEISIDKRLEHVPHLIEVKHLCKSYKLGRNKTINVLDNINFNIHKGELLGLNGKSGIGKTTLAKCLAGLEKPDRGFIKFSEDLSKYNHTQLIFQDSKSSLNPRMTVSDLIAESIFLSKEFDKSKSSELITPKYKANNKSNYLKHKIKDLLEMVELEDSLLHKRPYEISGGQRQRVAIARALAMNPKFLIADEPISSLDVAVQSQIIHLIKKIQEERSLTVLLISHDMPMLMHVCDRIISMI